VYALRLFDEKPLKSDSSEVYRYIFIELGSSSRSRLVRIDHDGDDARLTLKVWKGTGYVETVRVISKEDWMSFLQAVYEESFWLTSTSYKIEYATRELAYEVEAMPRPSGAYSLAGC
jgi:hypothetical protein